jgi:hypothetical protein
MPLFDTRCPGLHCQGCGKHGGGVGVVALVVVLAIAAAVVRAAWHAIVGALEIAAYTAASIAAVPMVAAAVYAVVRVRRRILEVRAGRISPRVRAVITDVKAGRPVSIPAGPARPALEAPGPRLSWPLADPWEEIRPRAARGGAEGSHS